MGAERLLGKRLCQMGTRTMYFLSLSSTLMKSHYVCSDRTPTTRTRVPTSILVSGDSPNPFLPDKVLPRTQISAMHSVSGKLLRHSPKWKYFSSVLSWEAPDESSSKRVQAEKGSICLWASNLHQESSRLLLTLSNTSSDNWTNNDNKSQSIWFDVQR